MEPGEVTALVLTWNEAENIGRCLERLVWTAEVLVIDSGSTDDTLEICSRYSNARVLTRKFDTFAEQCNFGLMHVKTKWVLSLDADYILPATCVAEIRRLDERADGYIAKFRYLIYGRPLRSCLYPARTVLYRRDRACYENIGHGHRVCISGSTEPVDGLVIAHDDRKPLARWLESQKKYAMQEADHLSLAESSLLSFPDRVRKSVILALPLVLLYTLIWKRSLLDGWPGVFYAFQRAYAELLLSLQLLDRKLRRQADSSTGSET